MPKRWIAHQKTIRKITEQIRKQFENRKYVGSVSYVPTDKMEGGVYYSEPEIAVRPNASDYRTEQLPEKISQSKATESNEIIKSGIQSRKMEGEMVPLNVDCYDEVSANPFPGGLAIQDGSTNTFGTSGCKVTDGNNDYLYTANHVIADNCHIGTGSAYDADGNYLGNGSDGHKTHDWLMVDDSGTTYSDSIWFEEGLTNPDGWMNSNGGDYLQGKKGLVKSQGVISGRQDAHVKGGGASGVANCMKFFGSGIKIGMPDYGRTGDSGGPIWWEDGNDDLIITVYSFGETSGTYSGCGVSGEKHVQFMVIHSGELKIIIGSI